MHFPTSFISWVLPATAPPLDFSRPRLCRLGRWVVSCCAFAALSLPCLPACAATPGDLFAEGYRHLTGQGFPRDATMAAHFFLEAAQAGEPQAQYQLGVMHMEGLGLPVDTLWAYFWLDQAIRSPGLPDSVREQARGRLEAIKQQLTGDQKRRLGLPGSDSRTP